MKRASAETSSSSSKKPRGDDVVICMRTSEGVKFKNLFSLLSNLIDCTLVFTKKGIFTNALDTHRVLTILSLDTIEDYVCNREKLQVGIQTSTFFSCLKNVGQDQVVEILITENDLDNSKIQLKFIKPNNRGVIEYEINMMDFEYEDLEIPDNEFKSILSIPSVEFQKALRCCGDASVVRISSEIAEVPVDDSPNAPTIRLPKMVIEAKDDRDGIEPSVRISLVISGEMTVGSDVAGTPNPPARKRVKPVLPAAPPVVEHIEKQKSPIEPVAKDLTFCAKNDWFGLKILTEVSRASAMNPASSVIIYLADDYPLVLDYSVGTMGLLRYLVAPQIILDDEEMTHAPARKEINLVVGQDEEEAHGDTIADDDIGGEDADYGGDDNGGDDNEASHDYD